MYKLADKIKNLEAYQPLSGNYKIRLDANESYIRMPDGLLTQIKKAIDLIDFNRYPDPYCKKLCSAFAKYYQMPSEMVTAGNGSDELISILVGCFLEKGEKLMTFTPDFSMYRFYGALYETENLVIPKREDLTIDIDQAISIANSSEIGAIILSNPCNPTSLLLAKEEIIKLLHGVGCLVIVDEAYMDFAEGSIMNLVKKYDNLVVLKTCSKAIGLASIRLGFAVAGPLITGALKAVKSPYNVNSVTQAIGEIVLSDSAFLQQCVHRITMSREMLYREMTLLCACKQDILQVYDTAANFVFVRMNGASEVQKQLAERSIAVRCMGEYLRITVGYFDENEKLLSILKEILK